MYTAHFGLKEPPFSISPDPRYLYMSERHREALAHLVYGVGEGGGFVQLTGEVGTGKTTVCRCLLEQVPSHVDVALILNPRLTATELLAAVCDELRVPYADSRSAKHLVDVLHRHLLDAHARGRRVVLIIDEAQNLDPEVLEQVRLLTNLETTTRKLLQIILIGQPELIDLLDQEDLRQVAQRVTARYHLLPFSANETVAYIRHRLAVAGQPERVFSMHALREIHRLSRGVPRLVNVICDRSLLGAYANDRHHVDIETVRRAATEVLGRKRLRRRIPTLWMATAAAAVLVVAAVVTVVVARPSTWRLPRLGPLLPSAAVTAVPAVPGTAASAAAKPPAPGAATAPVQVPPAPTRDSRDQAPSAAPRPAAPTGVVRANPRLVDLLSDPAAASDRRSAFVALYARWHQEYPATKNGLACEGARQIGLRCMLRTGTWATVRRFDLPAVLELTGPEGERRYATLTALEGDRATLELGGRAVTVPLAEVDPLWSGFFILLWRPPDVGPLPIGVGHRGKDVEWLQEQLTRLDGIANTPVGVFDEALRARVAAFQAKRALVPDGIVGEETLTLLTAAAPDTAMPSLAPGPR
jgi:general secretion pathway protein A